jgi:transcriptional accessory protein Tex/SPT6
MKNLQQRLNQLYEQQAIEEKKVMESLETMLTSFSPLDNIKNSWNDFISNEELDLEYPKQALTALINKTIDNLIEKPAIINQSIKILLKTRLIDALFPYKNEVKKDKSPDYTLTKEQNSKTENVKC